ncbi:hypothetical protein ALC56_09711 [Trachymyrmex septentrionalis]|uniref:Uncharacterized protein n=2 Tax=Trachymyrmex septentrionalis TaxID=34720 RepID=A0A195F5Q3_9HYME|nr:hypothetical protein ALC56_09711 [Trachymyrmex septentrionalis]
MKTAIFLFELVLVVAIIIPTNGGPIAEASAEAKPETTAEDNPEATVEASSEAVAKANSKPFADPEAFAKAMANA